jgi:WD40 repeat protein
MTTNLQEVRVSPASLMWGIFWRSVGGYTNVTAFCPDGDLLATGSAYGEVHLRRTTDRELLKAYEGHEDTDTDVVFSPDERRLISAGVDRRVSIWPVREAS